MAWAVWGAWTYRGCSYYTILWLHGPIQPKLRLPDVVDIRTAAAQPLRLLALGKPDHHTTPRNPLGAKQGCGLGDS